MAGLPSDAPATTDLVNATFVFKVGDDTKTGKLTLQKSDVDPQKVDDPQQFLLDISDTQGTSEGDVNRKDYANENFIANGDSQKTCIEKLDAQLKNESDIVDDHETRISQNETDIQAIEDSVGQPNGICPLDGDSEVPIGNLPQEAFDGLSPQGNWDADTNTPDIDAIVGKNVGDYWVVSVPGNTNLGGITDWGLNDWAIWTDSGWARNISSEVTSVNTKKGAVVLDNTDIGLGNVTNDAQLKRAAGDFDTFTEKATPVDDDIVLIEDSEDVFSKKKTKVSNLIGGGGGGGSFIWELNGDVSPLREVKSGISVLSFDHEEDNEIWAFVAVPASYKAGDQIQLDGSKFVSAGNSDNVFFKCQTYLNRDGEALNYQSHTSTNSEKALTTANVIVDIGLIDLTDGSGEINGVAVAPGDMLALRFFRDVDAETSSSTEYASFLKYSASVKFKP